MHVVHLTASTFFGGPERQMLGLAEHLAPDFRVSFVSFAEGGRCSAFLQTVGARGFDALPLRNDTPHLRAASRELAELLRAGSADVLLCHGYKPNLLGRVAARRAGVPAVAVSRGWTGESLKVRLYEAVDRFHLRFMDRVVAVSDGQATKVRRAGVPPERITVIRNAARLAAFADPEHVFRDALRAEFPLGLAVSHVVLAAGRLSPEKGFHTLVEAAADVLRLQPNVGFVLYGEGPERMRLEARVRALGIAGRFAMPGFTDKLDRLLPWADAVVLPSLTEGLPNVALEASAAGVPLVATAVGGTPEAVADGETGFLVPPGQPAELAAKLRALLASPGLRRRMGTSGSRRMREHFTFAAQARAYEDLFASLQRDPPCRHSHPRRLSRIFTSAARSASVSSSIT
jgi:glycosyltransferase involved in cell wall biosynthesis